MENMGYQGVAPDTIQLAKLINMDDPQIVAGEVRHILDLMFKGFKFDSINTAFEDMKRLFEGRYPGYRDCNTEYHDIKHTTDTVLAMVRLMHGATLDGEKFSEHDITLAVISAIFHDAGYIQTIDDTEGTGAKYTAYHVERSIIFLEKYCKKHGFSPEDSKKSTDMLHCTGLNVDISTIKFDSHAIEILGKMLGTADLLGQMADRNYLEKLLFLFCEFKEGEIGGYEDEFDLLRKTIGFYEMTKKRFSKNLGSVDRFMRSHFKSRWNIDRDMYSEAIKNQMNYLEGVIKEHRGDYLNYLRRGGVVEKLRKMYGK